VHLTVSPRYSQAAYRLPEYLVVVPCTHPLESHLCLGHTEPGCQVSVAHCRACRIIGSECIPHARMMGGDVDTVWHRGNEA
jgi:hypothetical protein